MHYDLNAFGLWFGAGLVLIIGGITVAGWKHRAVIIGLIAVGALFVLAALAWPFIQQVWPPLARFMSEAATPSTWVVLLLLTAAYLLLSPHFRSNPHNGKIPKSQEVTNEESVRHVSTPELRRDLEAQIFEVQKRINDSNQNYLARLTSLDTELADTKRIFHTFAHDRNQNVETLLSVVWAACSKDFYRNIVSKAPSLSNGDDEEIYNKIRNFIALCEAAFISLGQQKIFGNIMKNAEKEVDGLLESEPQELFDPFNARKRMIAKHQAELMVRHFESISYQLGEYLHTVPPMLMEKLEAVRAAMK